MQNKNKLFHNGIKLFLCLSIGIFIVGCEKAFEVDLPGANSKEDTIFPNANFSYASTLEDFKTIKFTNLSTEALAFEWDFGGGNTSNEQDPTFTFAAGEGTYPVTLIARDGNGVTGTVTKDVIVVEGPFQPIIQEPGFEDGTLPDGSGDGRDSWRNNDLGGVIQITGSPVMFGSQGAKLPNDQTRIGYQEITVEPNTNYDIRFWYTMLDDDPTDPFITVSVLGVTEFGPFANREEAFNGTIASITVNDTSDPSTYVEAKLSFNSGDNNVVAIFFFNGPVEARLDNFSIEVGVAGSVPPSAGFNLAQSTSDYLEYTFTNTSKNATSYEWDFGDGNVSTEVSPTHTYNSPDVYTVTLTAISAEGLSAELNKTIDIQAPVTADFSFEVDPNDYKTYRFMDASVGAVMLLWEFGDGYQFTGMNPMHTYEEDGTYTVKLTAYSLTGKTDEASLQLIVAQGFVVQVLNGTFDEYTNNTGDNADAWDMTPNSTVVDNNGNEIPSPYRELWNNSDLNAYIDATYCTNEQPATTSDGANGTRGAKFSNSCRRLYQVVQVEQGVTYNFSIDTRSEAEGVNTEVFILNTEITTEAGIDASKSDPAIDAYFDITNDFNTEKSMFTTSSFTFTASTNKVVIYVRALNAVDSSSEVFLDNVKIEE
jgi:PKD repeat protein